MVTKEKKTDNAKDELQAKSPIGVEKTMENNRIEFWKSYIDVNKTIISVCTGLLSVLITYLFLNNAVIYEMNFVPILLFMFTIFTSMMGFSRSLTGLKTDESKYVNWWSGGALILLCLSIISFSIVKTDILFTIDAVAERVEKETRVLPIPLEMKNLRKFNVKGSDYELEYIVGTNTKKVIFSEEKKKLIKY